MVGEKDIKPANPGNQATPGDGNKNRQTGGGGAGGDGCGRRNRHRYNTNNNNSGNKFVSRNKGIKHDVFDNTGTNNASLFNKSLTHIEDYLLEKLDHGRDVSDAVCNMTPVTITIPKPPKGLPDPNDNSKMLSVDDLQIFQWKDAFTCASKRKDYYDDGLDKAYVIIFNQCSTSLKNELKAGANVSTFRQAQNPIELLRLIQG
jgi:hypothetical protein